MTMIRRVSLMLAMALLMVGMVWFVAQGLRAAQTTYNVVSGSQAMCAYTYGTTNYINCSVPVEPVSGLATTGGTPYHALSTATAGGMSINVKATAGLVLGIHIVNPTATLGDFRLINSATAPTCSGGTNVAQNFPIQANTTAAGIVVPIPGGIYLPAGISYCFTGAVADNDATTPPAGVAINLITN